VRLQGNAFGDEALLVLRGCRQLRRVVYDDRFVSPEAAHALENSLTACKLTTGPTEDVIEFDD
jgi:hypothetical protein